MKIDTHEIMNGSRDGQTVWICHYNRPDMRKKALRNLPPTMVLVRSNLDLPSNKKVYYSQSHFVPIGSSGKPLSRIISPVDNTGYRSRCGNEVHVFDNEEDCNEAWNSQLKDHCEVLDLFIENSSKHWEDEKAELLKAVR